MKTKKLFNIFSMLFILTSCDFISSDFKTTSSINTFETSNISATNSFNSSSISSSSSSSISSNNDTSSLKTLRILSINDMHGKIEQENSLQGISNLSAEIERIKSIDNQDDVVLIANGDMFQGQAISNLNYGLSVINAMNAMNFDMLGIGNHEFDWGIDKITRFFDGNKENGEANFPLVNSNVYYRDTNNLLENSVPYHIIQKEDLKIGFVSAIGNDQYSSILKTRAEDYEFKDMLEAIANTAETLKSKEKCDIVIANIHDGGTTSYSTDNNVAIANLKGNQHIDALINGHTHYGYAGLIKRDGVSLPVVEAYSSSSSLGYIELSIENKKVVSASSKLIDMRYKKDFDQNIQDIVDNDYNLLKDQIEEVYGISGETITNTSDIQDWAGSCMQKATDADIAFSNNGGLRKVNLQKGQNIMLKDIYEINPFDNEIMLTTISGSAINNFISRYSSYNYYSIKEGVNITNSSSKYYNVAVIDYLGFKNYFPLGNEYTITELVFRDVLIQDIKARTKKGLSFTPKQNPDSYLTKLI